ncbi:phosphoenolpyruvate--protein phosphotransferase [symbiont of Argiope bruennichi]|uniref:putative PEP-binding protein n=1 Tax=symbiont of Argiope bruennichi TaxID=2810479 RepID=UPI003DA1CA60
MSSYKKVIEKLNNKICVIRTLDIGGDKNLKYFIFEKEQNPFLGVRAIRFCLRNIKIFQDQIRALLRSSIYGNLAIMLPMISNIDELKRAKKFIFQQKKIIEEEIGKEIKFSLGIMVEIPSVAINPAPFLKEVDFFSIGTNDLIQYTLAVDRTNNKLNNLYETLNPSVLKLIKNVLDLQKKSNFNNKWIGVCGQAASEPLFIPIALGLGLRNFSVSSSRFLLTKYLISNLNQKDCAKFAKKCLTLNSQKKIEKKATKFLKSLNLL